MNFLAEGLGWDLAGPAFIYTIGLILVVLEFFIPSGGLIALGAIVCLLYSIYEVFLVSPVAAFILVVMTVIYVFFAVRWGLRRLSFSGNVAGVATGKDVKNAASRIGEEGKAVTSLRPSGVAQFGNQRLDVVTRGGFVEAGDRVVILSAEGNRIVVKSMSSDAAEA